MTETGAERVLDLLGALGDVMDSIGEAVTAGEVDRLESLVPVEEALLREVAGLSIPAGMAPAVAHEIEERSRRVFKKNTENSLLIAEQLGLIEATIRALLGDGPHLDRMA